MTAQLTHTIEDDELIINRVEDCGTLLAEYRFRIDDGSAYWYEESIREEGEAHTLPADIEDHIMRNLGYDIAQLEPVRVCQTGADIEGVTFENPVELWGKYLSEQAYKPI